MKEIQDSREYIPRQIIDVLGISRLPIPFFGNLEHARLVSVALNPSETEFEASRGWDVVKKPAELTLRLVNCFRLAGDTLPPAHPWFGQILTAARHLECFPSTSLAHVDFCPWATYFLRRLRELDAAQPWQDGQTRRKIFEDFIDAQMEHWLPKVIRLCKNSAKLIVIIQTDNPSPEQRKRQQRAHELILKALSDSEWRGEIAIQSWNLLPRWVWEPKEHLRKLMGLAAGR